VVLLIGIAILTTGYFIMAFDQEEYGFGFLGLTAGPILVLTGFIVLFFSIFWNKTTSKDVKIHDKTDQTKTTYPIIQKYTGWLVFLIALSVYTLTAEPTVSLWDCGEFIAAAYKLEIPHPPGTPLFLLIGRIFSFFAPTKESIAFSINMVSVVASSFTILILYHSIVILGRRLITKSAPISSNNYWLILAASIGSLSFAFSDSFWFNATEAEVYALSSLFTALIFWAMLKWVEQTEAHKEDQWLLFIIYLTGLTMGVHLLNLVAIPALAFLVLFKKFKVTKKGIVCTLGLSVVLVFFFMEGFIIGIPTMASYIDRLFVNTFLLPFGTGIFFFFAIVLILIFYGLYYSVLNSKRILQLIVLSGIFLLAGASSNIIIPIRSAYNPPMDENDPEDVMSMVRYLKRDQYGSRPLLKGPHFTAGYPEQINKKSPRYRKDDATAKYVIYDYENEYIYNQKHVTLFPRLHFTEDRHKAAYKEWLHLKNGKIPTMKDNLKFLWEYQLGHMFWRYFLWNFAGRESDIQDADWLKPFKWFNRNVPDVIANNKARNNYYMLPLIIGLAGAFFHFSKNTKDAWVIMLLFLFCGVVINIYLNQPPTEPRERDYTYVGAFYAFSIWIGLGVFYLADLLSKIAKSKILSVGLTILITTASPALLAMENWDDHDRSGRYFARDLAKNMIGSCEQDAILFTGADNDTFPLWYLQETEDYRTDVRVCNLSLLNMDWHIRAMKIKSNKSQPLPISLEEPNFVNGKNDYIYKIDNPTYKEGIDLKAFLELLKQESKSLKYPTENGDEVTILPCNKILVNINKDFLEKDKNKLSYTKQMELIINGGLSKSELIVLDIISNNNWERAIYFDNNSLSEFPYLRKYTIKEGLLYRLFPIDLNSTTRHFSMQKMYQNLMQNYKWNGLNNPAVYLDPASSPFISSARNDYYHLAVQLYQEKKYKEAKKVIDGSLHTFPDHCVPYDYTILSYPQLLFALDKETEALAICKIIGDRSLQNLLFLKNQGKKKSRDYQYHLEVLKEIVSILEGAGKSNLSGEYSKKLNNH
jgi:hypothetical protein